MSRIGKQPVILPKGVTVTVGDHNLLTVKGPKGELKQSIDRDIKIVGEDVMRKVLYDNAARLYHVD